MIEQLDPKEIVTVRLILLGGKEKDVRMTRTSMNIFIQIEKSILETKKELDEIEILINEELSNLSEEERNKIQEYVESELNLLENRHK